MPNVDILSRTQQNEIYEWLQAGGLDPRDVDVSTVKERLVSDGLRFVHRPTGAHITVRLGAAATGYHISWRPLNSEGESFTAVDHWARATLVVRNWIGLVHRDHNAPDLWAAVAAETAIPDAAAGPDRREKFTAEEVKRLRAGLDEIERYITTTQPLDAGGADAVKRRFDYLRDAASAGVRKIDWLNIFVGQVFGMIVGGLIPSTAYGAIMGHAATVLTSVFQFALRLLGS